MAEDRDMLEEPGAPEYGAPAEYRVRLYGDTLLVTETSFEQLEASTGYMFGAEKAVTPAERSFLSVTSSS